jgi:hypothetical protein
MIHSSASARTPLRLPRAATPQATSLARLSSARPQGGRSVSPSFVRAAREARDAFELTLARAPHDAMARWGL